MKRIAALKSIVHKDFNILYKFQSHLALFFCIII